MSKNQKTYLLLLAVAIIWGAVGFQFYSHYNPDIPEVTAPTSERFIPKQQSNITTYTIEPNYRDPFLGKLYKKPKPKLKKKKVQPKPEVVFPAISYHGIIKSGKKYTYLISINGSQHIYKLKQAIKGVELVTGDENEVKLKYQGVTKTYPIIQ
jgi:hypothetical protein